MAPNVAESLPRTHSRYPTIISKSLKTNQITDVTVCSRHSITAIRSNLHDFGTTIEDALNPPLLDLLPGHLLEEMVVFG
jgi:hypothetical protein